MKDLQNANFRQEMMIWNYPAKNIKVDVAFGALGRNCNGLGICNVTVYNRSNANTNKDKCNMANAIISIDESGGIRFNFFKSSICNKAKRKFFSNGYFDVEELFTLPLKIMRPQKTKCASIGVGSYPIIETPNYFIVEFVLNKG